ncbi:MAG TPA: DUF177 domain-containing protein [Caulobacteraceae bacterium]|nr:DUF177 domain-containing protein [Caulobacteraceae bacterium]
MSDAWPAIVSLAEGRRGRTLTLEADPLAREAVALSLGIEAVNALTAEVTLAPWMDGAALSGRWRAEIVQICGVSLDPFESALAGEFLVRVLPATSPNAPPPSDGEVVIDPEAEDPPDLIDDEAIDVSAYVVEHLALELDPFPRKPGVAFEPPEAPAAASPFDVLRNLPRG